MTAALTKAGFGCWVVETEQAVYVIDTGWQGTMRFAVWPWLRRRIGSKTPVLIITHYHDNHIGDAAWLLGKVDFAAVYAYGVYSSGAGVGRPSDLPYQQAYLDTLDAQGKSEIWVSNGDTITHGDDHHFDVLWPLDPNNPKQGEPSDAMSCSAFKFHHGDFTALFPIDITSNLTSHLPDVDVTCTLLQSPHHGDPSALTAAEWAEPEVVIVGPHSAGTSDQMDYFASRGIEAWFVATQGHVTCVAEPDGSWALEPVRRGRQVAWAATP